jgi:hypothetical protein
MGKKKKLERKREDTKLIFALVITDTGAKKEKIEGTKKVG